MPSSSSKSLLKTSYKSMSSSRRGKEDSSTTILVSIALLLFIIIAGTIIYNSYNRENFTNQPNKLVYLYMETCGFCKEFDKVWEDIEKEDLTKYKINVNKFDLNKDGKDIANANSINYAPAIILITPNKHFLYEGERTKLEIFKWVSTKV
jgi:hypothetical protein